MRHRPLAAVRPPESGFTLIEVLVAILVLSLGVLGGVGMLTAAMQANREAKLQSVAVNLGRELGELMRANKAIAVQTSSSQNPYLFDYTATTSTSFSARSCMSSSCDTGSAIATADVAEWQVKLADQLPGARAVVCYDSTPYSSGVAQWGCSNSGSTAVVKIGWSRLRTDRGTRQANGAIDLAGRPSVVLPLIAGM